MLISIPELPRRWRMTRENFHTEIFIVVFLARIADRSGQCQDTPIPFSPLLINIEIYDINYE